MKYIILVILLSGCACMNVDTGFGLDGKAVSWCERRSNAEKFCEGRKVKSLDYSKVECE